MRASEVEGERRDYRQWGTSGVAKPIQVVARALHFAWHYRISVVICMYDGKNAFPSPYDWAMVAGAIWLLRQWRERRWERREGGRGRNQRRWRRQ